MSLSGVVVARDPLVGSAARVPKYGSFGVTQCPLKKLQPYPSDPSQSARAAIEKKQVQNAGSLEKRE